MKNPIKTSILTLAAFFLSSCQSSLTSQFSPQQTIGEIQNTTVKYSDLTVSEKFEIYNAQKKLYNTTKNVIEKHYLDKWFKEYQISNKIDSLENAKNDYFAKNITIPNEEIKKFIVAYQDSPKMQQIPENQREFVVKNYLSQLEQSKAERKILDDAESQGLLKITAFQKLYDFVVPLSSIGYVKDKSLNNPKVTLVEFADYECPYCVQTHATIEKLLSHFKGKIQFVFRDFPLSTIHPLAMPAAIAAKCASEQNKYWEMHNLLFDRNPTTGLTEESFNIFAEKLNLDVKKFKECNKDTDQSRQHAILKDIEEANNIGINATPTLFINGVKIDGSMNFEELKKIIEKKLSEQKS